MLVASLEIIAALVVFRIFFLSRSYRYNSDKQNKIQSVNQILVLLA